MDTASKRASSLGVLAPWQVSPPWPDGTLDQGDRQHIAFSYSGILAGVAQGLTELLYLLSPVELTRSLLSKMELARSLLSKVATSFNLKSEVD